MYKLPNIRRVEFIMRTHLKVIFRAKRVGQGMIEYAGAMVTAALIVAMLINGIQTDNWMYEAYENIFNAAGNMLVDEMNEGFQ